MSASLVGSEMCIRDSLEEPLPSGCFPTPRVLATKSYTPLGHARTCIRDCLLYTSDAADDM
eukprot:13678678-Alexandrium_andersonii.AAC.1